MTVVPLPASPCVRIRLDYTNSDGFTGGSRFYLSYSSSAPTAANCNTLATDVAVAWSDQLASLVSDDWILSEVDVLDIATDAGASGHYTGDNAGTNGTPAISAATAINVEYDIARRYRGGKPRMFLPSPVQAAKLNDSQWTSDFIGDVNAGMVSFFNQLAALSIGAMGTLAHVNLSYYAGFTNVTNSSGRTRAAPKYRATALVDSVEGYACKAVIGSQRRRRTATAF